MASESSSQQQPKSLTLTSNVHFECEDAHIAFNNASHSEETVRVALVTLGLADEKDPQLSSTDLVNSSPLNIRYFSATWRVIMLYIVKCLGEIPLTSYMLQVAKKFDQPEKSLILPSGEVDAEYNVDKSLSGTTVHHHAEETVATADATQSIDVFESAKDLGNQPKTIDAKKVQEQINEEVKEDFGIKSLGNVSFDELYRHDMDTGADESPFDIESKTKFVGKLVSGFEADTDDNEDNRSEHKEELSKTDEVVGDNMIDELIDIAHSKDASADNPAKSDPLGHLQANISSLSAKVENLESSLAYKCSGEQSSEQAPSISTALLIQSSEKPPFNKLKVVLEDFPTPTPTLLNSIKPSVIINNILFYQYTINIFSSGSSNFSPKPPPKVADKEVKARATELAAYKEKKAKTLKEYNHCISFRDDPLPITKISYRVNNSTKEATMRITRNNRPLNYKIYDKFVLKMLGFSELLEVIDVASKNQNKSNDQLLKNLKPKFQWRRAEVIHEVFLKDNSVVDGMHRNLVPHARVIGSLELLIEEPEARIFVYNRSFNLVFHREERNNNRRRKLNADAGTGSFTESDGSLNDTNPLKDVVSPSVINEPVAMEMQSSLVDKTNAVKTCVRSYPPLPTQGTTPAGNTPGKSSYANVIGKPSKKALNFHTLFTLGGTGLMFLCWWIQSELLVKERIHGSHSRNQPPLLRKWNPDVDLMKEDDRNVPVWVKLHGVPVTAFSKDGLSAIDTKHGTPLMLDSYTSDICLQSWGRSSYARAMIELRADMELKDTILVAMLKITGEYYMCIVRVEYEWKPPRCFCCKVFGPTQEECPKNIGLGVAKNLKKPSQTSRGVPIGLKVGFKPTKEYRPVPKKPTANSSSNKKKCVVPTNEVSNLNPFDVFNSVDNDVELGTSEEISNLDKNRANSSGSSFWNVENSSTATLVDDAGNPLKKVEYPDDQDSEDEVASDDNDMARSMALERVGFGTQSVTP
ncbi:retrotransposon protein, putative, ty1-copia subclass [Tanacetum coccineum]